MHSLQLQSKYFLKYGQQVTWALPKWGQTEAVFSLKRYTQMGY